MSYLLRLMRISCIYLVISTSVFNPSVFFPQNTTVQAQSFPQSQVSESVEECYRPEDTEPATKEVAQPPDEDPIDDSGDLTNDLSMTPAPNNGASTKKLPLFRRLLNGFRSSYLPNNLIKNLGISSAYAAGADPLPRPGTGHMYVVMTEKAGNGVQRIQKSGGYMTAWGPYRQGTFDPAPGQSIQAVRGIEGPTGTFKFYNLPAHNEPANPNNDWEWRIVKWGHNDYDPPGGLYYYNVNTNIYHNVTIPPRFTVFEGKTVLDIRLQGEHALTQKGNNGPAYRDQFNSPDYNYIRQDKNWVIDALANKTTLDCNTKNKILQTLESDNYFSMYEAKPKADVVVKKIAPISSQAAGYLLEPLGYGYGITNKGFQAYPPNDPRQTGAYYIGATQKRIRTDLHKAISTHDLNDWRRYSFLPFAQEYARSGIIFSLFGQFAPGSPAGPEFDHWKDKAWFKATYPGYFDWFYTYWFPPDESFEIDPNRGNWTSSEYQGMVDFFHNFSIYNSDGIYKETGPVEATAFAIISGGVALGADDAIIAIASNALKAPMSRFIFGFGAKAFRPIADQAWAHWEQEAVSLVQKQAVERAENLLKAGSFHEAKNALTQAFGQAGAEQRLRYMAKEIANNAAYDFEQQVPRGGVAKAERAGRLSRIPSAIKSLANPGRFTCKVVTRINLNICFNDINLFKYTTLKKEQRAVVAGRMKQTLEEMYSTDILKELLATKLSRAQNIVSSTMFSGKTSIGKNLGTSKSEWQHGPFISSQRIGAIETLIGVDILDDKSYKFLDEVWRHEAFHHLVEDGNLSKLGYLRRKYDPAIAFNDPIEEGIVEFWTDYVNKSFGRKSQHASYGLETQVKKAMITVTESIYKRQGVTNYQKKALTDHAYVDFSSGFYSDTFGLDRLLEKQGATEEIYKRIIDIKKLKGITNTPQKVKKQRELFQYIASLKK